MLRTTVLVAGLYCLTAPCAAQPLFSSTDSLAYRLHNCRHVAVGELQSIAEHSTDRSRPPTCVISLTTSQTLKGSHTAKVKIRVRTSQVRESKPGNRLLVYSSPRPEKNGAIDLAAKHLEVVTTDFQVLRTAKEVIARTRKVIAGSPGVTAIGGFRRVMPQAAAQKTRLYRPAALFVIVPIEPALERKAHALIQSKSTSERAEGARALRYFRSAKNIAIAKGMLTDRGYGIRRHAMYNKGVELRYFFVRGDAYETLQYWGVKVQKPEMFETVKP